MPRPINPDLNRWWKLGLPATLAGKLEYMLADPIHQKPIYGVRNKLSVALYEWWIARENGVATDDLPKVPTLLELRERS